MLFLQHFTAFLHVMTTFLQTTITFLQVSLPTLSQSAFFTPSYKHPFGLYERLYYPPPTQPTPACQPPPTHPARPPGPPPHLPTLPAPKKPAASRSSAPVPTRRVARRLEPAHVCVEVQSISKRHLSSMTPPTFSNPPPSFLHIPHQLSPTSSFLQTPSGVGAAWARREGVWGRRGGGAEAAWRRRGGGTAAECSGVGAAWSRRGGVV